MRQTLMLRKDEVTKNFKSSETTLKATDHIIKIQVTPAADYLKASSGSKWKAAEKRLVAIVTNDDPNLVRLNGIIAEYAKKIKSSKGVTVTEYSKSNRYTPY